MKVKKRRYLLIWLVPIWFFMTAMGRYTEIGIPTPSINFAVTIIDNQEIATRCQEFSWEGKTFMTGRRGEGIVTIPFEKIKNVSFIGDVENNQKNAQITMLTGERVAVRFDSEAILYGNTNFGSFRINAGNVKEIIFEGKKKQIKR